MFWRQTERSYAIALEAASARIKRDMERDRLMAWNIGVLSGAAYHGKIKSFDECFPPPGFTGTKGASVVLGALMKMNRKFQREGKFMEVERILLNPRGNA